MTRIITAAVASMLLSLLVGSRFIGWLRRNEIGQFIREEGPEGHRVKAGTPTMGGLLIVASFVVPFLILSDRSAASMTVLFAALGCAGIGLLDDYTKVVQRRSLGLKGVTKFALLLLIALFVSFVAVAFVGTRGAIDLPFVETSLKLGLVYVLLTYFVVAGTSNAVNLTDGLDGLAAGSVAIALVAYVAICFTTPGARDLAILSSALAGSCVGFLWFNTHPADVFMGDTGSLALGGALAGLAVMTQTEVVLIVIGGLFVIEALSVMIQVAWFKRFGQRVFLMTPIHHHFEMKGWTETKIIVRLWIAAAACAAIGFAIYYRDRGGLPIA